VSLSPVIAGMKNIPTLNGVNAKDDSDDSVSRKDNTDDASRYSDNDDAQR